MTSRTGVDGVMGPGTVTGGTEAVGVIGCGAEVAVGAAGEPPPDTGLVRLNTALAAWALVMVKLQIVPLPALAQAPPQPAKTEVWSAEAVKMTVWPELMALLQMEPQVKPAPVMVPLPEPDVVTLRV